MPVAARTMTTTTAMTTTIERGREHMKSAFSRIGLAAAVTAALASAPAAQARVTRIVIDTTSAIAGQPNYEQLTGRAFGELDPNDPHNALITDVRLAPTTADGKLEYIASFVLRKPKAEFMGQASGVMWHDVPNRGGDVNFPSDSFAGNDIQLLSGWQGDNAGGTAVPANAGCLPPYVAPCAPPVFVNHYVKVPVLGGVTGRILGRIVNRSGTNAPLNVQNNPLPYFPANSAEQHRGDAHGSPQGGAHRGRDRGRDHSQQR